MRLVKSDSLVETGLRAADNTIFEQNRIWARFASEKPDVSASLMRAIRALHARVPEDRPLSALSIGAGSEPQFRILQAGFERGLWLYDIDGAALASLKERLVRQQLDNVHLVQGDYSKDFLTPEVARQALASLLDGEKQDLITLHHALYYAPVSTWPDLITALYGHILAENGVMHMALMSARETRPHTSTWLYNHFAGKFFGSATDQDLLQLRQDLSLGTALKDCQIVTEKKDVTFWADDFELFMSAVWMILLHPHAHEFNLEQRVEITEFVIEQFWIPQRPLVQVQDYLAIHKLGIAPPKGAFHGNY